MLPRTRLSSSSSSSSSSVNRICFLRQQRTLFSVVKLSFVCLLSVLFTIFLLSRIPAAAKKHHHLWNTKQQQSITSALSMTTKIQKPITNATTTNGISRHHHAVVCFGDSLTAGTSGNFRQYPYAPHLEKALQQQQQQQQQQSQQGTSSSNSMNVTVSHLGFPGWTTQKMLNKMDGGLKFAIQEATINDRPPSLVIILAGTNDLGRFIPISSRDDTGYDSDAAAQAITENILALHRVCLDDEMHVARTLAIAIPPSRFQHYNKQAAALALAINEKLQDYSRRPETRTSYMAFPFHFTRGGELWNDDGLHFSPRGYQVLGESLVPVVAAILNEL